MAAVSLEAYLAAREELIARATGGTGDAQALAGLTDEAVSALAEAASSRADVPFSLFALGGYGAGRLLPHSDIDLLIIARGGRGGLEPIVRAVIYPLWDAGLAVGHQVRSPADHVRALDEDLEILTSFLTARLLAGDSALAEQTLTAAFKRVRKDRARIMRALAARERPGSPYLLEPDLKEGTGGQRDLDELVWRAAIEAGAPARDVWPLVAAGILDASTAERLSEAQDALSAARWRLHAAAGRARNTLSLPDVESAGVDAEAVQRALVEVAGALTAVRDSSAGRAPAAPPPVGLRELERLSERGPAALGELESLAADGSLDHLLPGIRSLMTLRRPALSHRYTVGAHCLRTFALARHPRPDQPPVSLPPLPAAALLVAALAHDAGKRDPGPGHADRGVTHATALAKRLGLDDETARAAGVLVREHLLLAEVATGHDLADEDVVLAAAARLGDRRLIEPLFLLTAADMRATGPDVWTPWRATLVAELAAKLDAALSPEIDGAGLVAAAERTRAAALRSAASAGSSRAVLAFLEHAPLRYLARRSPDEVLHDARLVQTLAGPGLLGEVAFSVAAGPTEGTWLVDVVTRDRPGLFAIVSGALALSGLDVLSADAFTEQNGIALDTFTVTSATLAPVEPATWNAFKRTLDAAIGGALDLDTRLAERRRHYPSKHSPRSAGVRVTLGTPGPFSTRVRVRAADRVGLLHDLARAFQSAGLDIRRAAIATTAGIADDAFEVTDAEGMPPESDSLHATLVGLLEAAARS